MYAIIATGGKQYKVTAGDKIRVEKLDAEVGSKITIDQVLLVSADQVCVGSPYVDGACVEAEVSGQGKGKKVIVYKYKPKSGYHKKNGHRQLFTELTIEKVVLNGVELEADKKEEPVKAEPEAVEEVAEAAVEETAEAAEEAAEEVTEEVAAAVEEAAEEAAEAAEEA